LIAAAGKGKRSKLDYPKTLFKIKKKPILINLIETFLKCNFIIKKISIIVSKDGFKKIEKTIILYGYQKYCEILIQEKQKGMGDAVYQIKKSNFINNKSQILLVWGDLISPQIKTINKLVRTHFLHKNTFSLISIKVKDPYTIIKRDQNNRVLEIIETKNKKTKYNYGERDIGLFIFKLKPTLETLLRYISEKSLLTSKEINFLPIVKNLVNHPYRVECICCAEEKDTLSFNSINDIKKISNL